MDLSYERGKRGAHPERDQKIFVRTNGRELWSYKKEFLRLFLAYCRNEDAIFPQEEGFMGCKMLLWFLRIAALEGEEAAIRKMEARERAGTQRRLFDRMEEEGLEA